MQVRIAQAQISPAFGDYGANVKRFGELAAQAVEEECQLLILPEAALSGYFLEGGVVELARTREQVVADLCDQFHARCPKGAALDVLVGFYELFEGNVYNAALYASLGADADQGGTIRHVHQKVFLPTYGVFDEQRFVARGRAIRDFPTALGRSAVLICEDVWHSVTASIAALRGAQFIHIITASPGRGFNGRERPRNLEKWLALLEALAEEHAVFVTHTARVGFENGKGFAGGSAAVNPDGTIVNVGPTLEETMLCTTFDTGDLRVARANLPLVTDLREAAGDLAMEFLAATQEAREELNHNAAASDS